MSDENTGTIAPLEPSSVDDIAAGVIADMDAPPAGEETRTDTSAAEGDKPTVGADAGDEAATAPVTPEGEASEDFLSVAGITLEEMLDGITDETQREFLTTRHKQMQAHFTRSNMAAREAAKQAPQLESTVEQLKAQLAEMQAKLERGETRQAQQPVPSSIDARHAFIHRGIDKVLTPEDAVTSEANLAEYVRQQAVIAAREAQLDTMGFINQRITPVESAAKRAAMAESEQMVERLFSDAPQYRTPEIEGQIAELLTANPSLPLEAAFHAVVGPMMQTDALRLGARAGEIRSQKLNARKAEMSVPSSGGAPVAKPLPDRPTVDEAFAYAIESLSQGE